MKALTICQPYAELIVQGRKTCENRTWPTSYRGLMFIHAGKSRKWFVDDDDLIETCGHMPPFGAVVATANLVACIHRDSSLMNEWMRKMTEEQQSHVNGPYCWIFDTVTPIGPWPWRGAQGLFEIDHAALIAPPRRGGLTTCDMHDDESY